MSKVYTGTEFRNIWKTGMKWEATNSDGSWGFFPTPPDRTPNFNDAYQYRLVDKKKKFSVSTAQIGDIIPTGTVVYKKVLATIDGNIHKAILTGVVTKAGIVTDDGAEGKCRVRGLMPVSIVAAWPHSSCPTAVKNQHNYWIRTVDRSDGGYRYVDELLANIDGKKWELVNGNIEYSVNVNEAVSTMDGTNHNTQHPKGITYKVGERVSVKEFDTSTTQCSAGIHVYLTYEGAFNY